MRLRYLPPRASTRAKSANHRKLLEFGLPVLGNWRGTTGVGVGVGVPTGGNKVAVGGSVVAVGSSGVAVGGTGVAVSRSRRSSCGGAVAVGGMGVADGCTAVSVGGSGVADGGIGVLVGGSVGTGVGGCALGVSANGAVAWADDSGFISPNTPNTNTNVSMTPVNTVRLRSINSFLCYIQLYVQCGHSTDTLYSIVPSCLIKL